MFISGLRDFNTLRAEEEETEEDSEDPYCQVDLDNDPHVEEEIATIERMMQEMEDKIQIILQQVPHNNHKQLEQEQEIQEVEIHHHNKE